MNHPLMNELRSLFKNHRDPSMSPERQARALVTALPLIAQSLVVKPNKQIQFRIAKSGMPRTDGTTVYTRLDLVPCETDDANDEFLMFAALQLGFIHHEIAHINETEFFPLDELDNLTRVILNILEDVRIENRHISRFPNARARLDAVEMVLEMHHDQNIDFLSMPPTTNFLNFLLLHCRSRFRQQSICKPRAERLKTVLETQFNPWFVCQLEAILLDLSKAISTRDALTLAVRVRQFLEDQLQAAKQQSCDQDQGHSDADQQSQDSPSQSASSQFTGQQSASNGSGQADLGDSTQESSNSATDDGSLENSADGDAHPNDARDTLVQNLEDMVTSDIDPDGYDVGALIEEIIDKLSDDLDEQGNTETINITEQSLTFAKDVKPKIHVDHRQSESVITRIRVKMQNEFQATNLVRNRTSRTGFKIDAKRLDRIATGDPRVFKRNGQTTARNTSVVIACDVSGSMANIIQLTNQALFAASAALESLTGVEVAVIAFPDRLLVLPFDRRASKNRDQFRIASRGGTPMHGAILQAHSMLSQRRTDRKILVLISDGEPDSTVLAESAIDFAAQHGTETYGIGIASESIRDLVPNSAVINMVSELPEAMLRMLRPTLIRAA